MKVVHISYLSVEQNVDDWVVESSTLGEEGWSSHEHWAKFCSPIGKNVPSYTGVGNPAHQEGDDHDDDQTCHLFLCSLGGFRLLLQGCSLGTKRKKEREAGC